MKKKLLILTSIFAVLFLPASAKTPYNFKNYPAQVQVTGSSVNVRSGPGTAFKKVGLVYKGQKLECIGKIGTWFVVHLDDDTVGAISGNYSKAYYANTGSGTNKNTNKNISVATATAEEKQMLELVNAERARNGLSPLTMNADLLKLARLKSQDMVKLGYFSHTSPTYGTPFEMLKSFGVTYKAAGENLAANSSVSSAHTALMNSAGHRANILNKNYTIVGIGVVDSPKYGKMITQLFVGR